MKNKLIFKNVYEIYYYDGLVNSFLLEAKNKKEAKFLFKSVFAYCKIVKISLI